MSLGFRLVSSYQSVPLPHQKLHKECFSKDLFLKWSFSLLSLSLPPILHKYSPPPSRTDTHTNAVQWSVVYQPGVFVCCFCCVVVLESRADSVKRFLSCDSLYLSLGWPQAWHWIAALACYFSIVTHGQIFKPCLSHLAHILLPSGPFPVH